MNTSLKFFGTPTYSNGLTSSDQIWYMLSRSMFLDGQPRPCPKVAGPSIPPNFGNVILGQHCTCHSMRNKNQILHGDLTRCEGECCRTICLCKLAFLFFSWFVASGNTHIGLIQTCLTIYNRSAECFIPDSIRPEWMLTFVFIAGGITCVTITIILLACSYWRYRIMRFARWSGFFASEL